MRVGSVPEAEGNPLMSPEAPGHGEIPAHVYHSQPTSASLLQSSAKATTVISGTNPAVG